MGMGRHLELWCRFRGMSVSDLAEKADLPLHLLHSFQGGEADISISALETLAEQLEIPPAWLYYSPLLIQRLWNDPDDDSPELPETTAIDPLLERILQVSREHEDLFILLTSLLHHGDPKLIRAAHVSLQSLLKQARPTTLPWGSRPPGHFEPPSE